MCGIGLVVTVVQSPDSTSPSSCSSCPNAEIKCACSKFHHDLQQRLCQRGPDHYYHQIHRIALDSTSQPKELELVMHSAVLHLRGNHVIYQPRVDLDKNILCWNGEIFGMGGQDISLNDIENKHADDDDDLMHGSDTVLLSEKLQWAGRQVLRTMTKGLVDPVVEVLRRVRGPFAVIWLHVDTQRVYFAHDRFGRRSLLYKKWETDRCGDMIAELAGTETTSKEFLQNDLTRFVLSNVAIGNDDQDLMQYQELPASGIYVMDLRACEALTEDKLSSYRMEFHPFAAVAPNIPLAIAKNEAYIFDRFGCKLPFTATKTKTDQATMMLELSGQALMIALSDAVGVRVRSIPSRPSFKEFGPTARVAVLFSGGLDSVVIAALTHFHAPATEPVDLLTVCFDENSNFASPDRLAAESAHAELCTLFPTRQWNLIKVNVSRAELSGEQREIQTLMAPSDTCMDFNIGAAFWFLSRGCGVLTKSTQVAEVATLDELNAFLKPQETDLHGLEKKAATFSLFDDKTVNDSTLLCPVIRCGWKRKHGCVLRVCKSCCFKIKRALNKLVSPKSQHVDQREVQGSRAKLLSMGISEGQLDLLLDLAHESKLPKQHFFTCCVHRSKQTQLPTLSTPVSAPTRTSTASHYQTNARVVLVGIGADEQLAGYGRHRTTLINRGEHALRAELNMDLSRIWKRNLGRDDRCIAAHGREARFPYLDETVVSTMSTFPISILCDADLPRGVGDKRVLRIVANALGLTCCAGLAKRAIQFGSRIAKVSINGTNHQTQGTNKFSSMC